MTLTSTSLLRKPQRPSDNFSQSPFRASQNCLSFDNIDYIFLTNQVDHKTNSANDIMNLLSCHTTMTEETTTTLTNDE